MNADPLHLRTILFPTDGTAWAEHAFAQAVFYATRSGAALHVLTVRYGADDGPPVRSDGDGSGDLRERLRRAAAAAVGLDAVIAEQSARSPEEGILDYARSVDADLIVMATHGRTGLDHLVMGSVTEAVVRRASCPVLTAHPLAAHTAVRAQDILVPVDFSDCAALALAHGQALARLHGATLHLAHVVRPPYAPARGDAAGAPVPDEPVRIGHARRLLDDLAQDGAALGVPVECHVTVGQPEEAIPELARALGAGLVVMGTHGRTGLRRLVLGSVAEHVVRHAPCPVFVSRTFAKALVEPQNEDARPSEEAGVLSGSPGRTRLL